MKLELFNFKCYHGLHTFEFMNTGSTLITGESGCGKTSILSAIYFSIYGNGGSKNISEGETTCSVRFTFDNWSIKRTCKPNHCVLLIDGAEFQGDEANARILNMVRYVGYIQQHGRDDFLTAQPAEKMRILEGLLFSESPKIMKERASQRIKDLTRSYDHIRGIVSGLETSTQQLPKLKLTDQKLSAIDMKHHINFLRNKQYLTDKYSQVINTLVTQIHELEEFVQVKPNPSSEYTKEMLEKHYAARIELDRMGWLESERYSSVECETQIKSLEERERNALLVKSLTCTFDELKKKTVKPNIPRLSVTREQLEKHCIAREELDKINWLKFLTCSVIECDEMIYEYLSELRKQDERILIESSIQKLSYDQTLHSKIIKDLELLQNTVEAEYVCPSCNTSLELLNDSLRCRTEGSSHSLLDGAAKRAQVSALEKKIVQFQIQQKTHEDLLQKLEEIPEENVSELKDQLVKWKDYRERARIIQKFRPLLIDEILSIKEAKDEIETVTEYENYQTNFRIYEKQLEDVQNQLTDIKYEENLSLKDIESELVKWRENRKRAELIENLTPCLINENLSAADAEEELKLLNDFDAYESQLLCLTDKQHRLQLLKTKANEINLSDHSEEIRELEFRHMNQNLYEETVTKMELLESKRIELDHVEKRLESVIFLHKTIAVCEMEHISDTIHVLENIANEYAAKLFKTEIRIDIRLFRESKVEGSKPRIDVDIHYKGSIFSFGMLSGGEQARLIVCFTLAFVNYFHSPFMLLDETTSQLDEENINLVMNLLCEQTSCKIIIIAHQIIQGVFDEIICCKD